MFKLIFYLINTIFTIFYLYPGSIFGFLLYRNFNKQPQLTDDFNFFLLNFSSNHVYAFLILSFFGFLLFFEKKKKIDLIAIGIGHDVSKYYNNAFTIDDVEKLGEIIIDNLTEIIKDKR